MSRYQQLQEMMARDTDECVLWPYANVRGYGRVSVNGTEYLANRIACLDWNGPPDDPQQRQAAHNCGRPACVNGRHLRWATPVENAADRVGHGTAHFGEQLPSSKLTTEQVRAIRAAVAAGQTQASQARKYGVHPPQIHRIVHRDRWAWLDAPIEASNNKESEGS